MSVSLQRARECIGRRIESTVADVRGTVSRVGEYDVYVALSSGEVIPCDPENLNWVATFPDGMLQQIAYGADDFRSVQVRYAADIYSDDDDENSLPGIGVVYSATEANDDAENHPLYVVAHHSRRVYPVRITADPFGAFAIEEYLGWVKP